MKDDLTPIIRDVIALYLKYDSTRINEALSLMRSGQAFEGIAQLIESGAKFPRSNERKRTTSEPRGGKRTPKNYLHIFYDRLRDDSKQNVDDIREFLGAVERRELLASAPQIREFAATLGIALPRAKLDRYVATRRIGEALLSKTPVERQKMFEAAQNMSSQASSLQGWSDIILKPR